jgi:predicted DNA-binding protein with PD1-like motif
MEYSVGRTGRIIGARLFEGEDLYESIEHIANAENIKSAAVLITGGFRKANVVVGPKSRKSSATTKTSSAPEKSSASELFTAITKDRNCISIPQSAKATKQ